MQKEPGTRRKGSARKTHAGREKEKRKAKEGGRFMKEYLSPEQRTELEKQLQQNDLPEDQAETAFQQGALMAQEDEEREQERRLLNEHGFENATQLLEAWQRTQAAVTELREMLERLTALEQADRTAAELDPMHPEYAVRRRIELELRPMREQAKQATRNRMIQQDWKESAVEMQDLEQMLPEIAEYIMRNPRYAGESDGLRRAYDAVRSAKYRDEDAMLDDPEFISRMASDKRIREEVLRAHLDEIRKTGNVPQAVGVDAERGKTPMTTKRSVNGMEQAKKRLEAALIGR